MYIPWYSTWCLQLMTYFSFKYPSLTAWYSVTMIFMYNLSKLVTSKFLNVSISNGFRGPDSWEMWLEVLQNDAYKIYIMCHNGHNQNGPLLDGWLSLAIIFISNRGELTFLRGTTCCSSSSSSLDGAASRNTAVVYNRQINEYNHMSSYWGYSGRTYTGGVYL